MKVNVIGVEVFNKKLGKALKLTDTYIRDDLEGFGEKTQIRARKVRRFQSQSGNLVRSVKRQFKKLKTKQKMRIYLDGRMTRTRKGSYGVYVHNGTRAHKIVAKKAKALKFNGRFAKSVSHPGTREDPFLKNAFDKELPGLRRRLRKIPKRVKRIF